MSKGYTRLRRCKLALQCTLDTIGHGSIPKWWHTHTHTHAHMGDIGHQKQNLELESIHTIRCALYEH